MRNELPRAALAAGLRGDGRIQRTTEVPGVPEESDLIVRALRRLADVAESGSSHPSDPATI